MNPSCDVVVVVIAIETDYGLVVVALPVVVVVVAHDYDGRSVGEMEDHVLLDRHCDFDSYSY